MENKKDVHWECDKEGNFYLTGPASDILLARVIPFEGSSHFPAEPKATDRIIVTARPSQTKFRMSEQEKVSARGQAVETVFMS